jgi:hypothetical protein
MGAGLGLGPGAGVAAVALEPAQALVPGRMEVHLVAAVAVAVEEFQHRREDVGQPPVFDPLRAADLGAARHQPVLRPAGALLRHGLLQRPVVIFDYKYIQMRQI